MSTINPISVLLPVFNSEQYLKDTINSVLSQTFTDFELIIINDGSTDASESIIKSYSDERILLVNNEENLGLIKTLNKGLGICRGKYIVRMDSDDIMIETRLEDQFKFMEKHPEIIASGTALRRIGRLSGSYFPPKTDKLIRETLFLGSPIPHPTAIIRREILCKYNIEYDINYLHLEDYELWYKLSSYGKLANLNKRLLLYRISETQISTKYNNKQERGKKEFRKQIYNEYLLSLGLNTSFVFDKSFLMTLKAQYKLKHTDKKSDPLNLLPVVLFIAYISIPNQSFSIFLSFLKDIKRLGPKYFSALLLHFLYKRYDQYSLS